MISKYEGGFDLHGHSKIADWRRSFDLVNMTPEQIVFEAKKSGLDGVAITDHDSIGGLDRALNAAAKEGVIVVPGVEITAQGIGLLRSLGPHILALGLNP
ncbi:PHP domain-containing protein [Patescibacteria group bacterium]|nr:PHP domain-containing protein [Patescibacteria group bacterium]